MLVFYSGWGYWEIYSEEEDGLEYEPFGEEYCLFKLPEKAEMEVKYQGETTVSYLLPPKHSVLSNPPKYPLLQYPRFILCEERKGEQKFSIDDRPIIKKTVKYTWDDIVESPDGDDTPKNLTETERNTMLKLIIGMAIDAYGYDPKSHRNALTGDKNGLSAKLLTHNIKISDDTIRKYLNEAKDLI